MSHKFTNAFRSAVEAEDEHDNEDEGCDDGLFRPGRDHSGQYLGMTSMQMIKMSTVRIAPLLMKSRN